MYWYPWDDTRRDAWVREMPQKEYVVNLENNPISTYRYRMASGGPCQAVRQMVPHFTRRPENRLSAGIRAGRIPAAVQRLFKQEIRLQGRMLDQQAVQGRLVRVAPVRLVHQRYMARQLPVRLRLQPLVRPVLHGRPQALADARGLAVQ